MGKFEKGKSGNPEGRPKLPAAALEAKKLTAAEIVLKLSEFMLMTPAQRLERLSSPNRTTADEMIGAIIEKGIIEGSPTHLNFIFDRTVGKVTDKLDVTVPTPFILTRSDGTQVVMGTEIKKVEGK